MRELKQSDLKKQLKCYPKTGIFIRLTGPYSGGVAGTDKHGYIQIQVNNTCWYAHRLAFLYMSDNRWDNLRSSSPVENMSNCDRNNSTVGVSYIKSLREYQVRAPKIKNYGEV